jgi:hypothetical protein
MPVSVRLDFTPPSVEDVSTLYVEEAPASGGPFSVIDTTTAVGTYPGYISYYTTQNATDVNYWFRIRWETSDGVFTPYSAALMGGTKTLVQEIVDRVMLRNPSMNEIVVTQEAQAVVSQIFGTQDPNSIPVSQATYTEIRGMTNLTLARSLVATYLAVGGSVSGYTAGLVSLKGGTTSSDPTKAIDALIALAAEDLPLVGQYSVILLMADVESSYCAPRGQLHGVDLTRAVVDYETPAAISP